MGPLASIDFWIEPVTYTIVLKRLGVNHIDFQILFEAVMLPMSWVFAQPGFKYIGNVSD